MDSNAEKRIAIAKDVLRSLRRLRKVERGTYLGISYDLYFGLDGIQDARDILPVMEKECRICALGVCFLSHVRVFDKIRGSDIRGGRDSVIKPLLKYFSHQQLALIETAFERRRLGILPWYEGIDDAVKFGQKYFGSKKCIRAIMLNLIKNKGTFIP